MDSQYIHRDGCPIHAVEKVAVHDAESADGKQNCVALLAHMDASWVDLLQHGVAFV